MGTSNTVQQREAIPKKMEPSSKSHHRSCHHYKILGIYRLKVFAVEKGCAMETLYDSSVGGPRNSYKLP